MSATAVLDRSRAQVAPNSMAARVFLSFLATAGFFYVNIMPALVSGLIDGLGFSAREAGLVSSANVYGAAFGALVIVFFVGRVRWRPFAWTFLASLVALDLVSMALREAPALIAVRFLHGAIGGALVGLTYSIMARTQDPDRTFGVLLIVQFGLGGVGLLLLPPLVPQFGAYVLFLALILFSVAAGLMLRFLPDYDGPSPIASSAGGAIPLLLLLALLSIFLFQAANMGLTAFVIEIARSAGLGSAETGMALAVANWLGIAGAAIVVALPARVGRRKPLAIGMALTAIGSWCLHFSGHAWIYFAANGIVAVTWAMVIAYLLGMCAQFKADGRLVVLGGFVSKMGLASGPAAFALASGTWSYSTMIDVSVAVLVVSAIVCLVPAAHLDRQRAAVAPPPGSA